MFSGVTGGKYSLQFVQMPPLLELPLLRPERICHRQPISFFRISGCSDDRSVLSPRSVARLNNFHFGGNPYELAFQSPMRTLVLLNISPEIASSDG